MKRRWIRLAPCHSCCKRALPSVLLTDAFVARARAAPDRVAVIAGGCSYTYGDLLGRAYGVAAEQLGHGVSVVAECVNPLGVTRDAWRDVAAGHGARLVEVELVCTDQAAHRERARTREVDIRGLRLPDWEQITSREYEPWDRGHLVIDTATRTPAEAVATILAAIPERAGHVSADPD